MKKTIMLFFTMLASVVSFGQKTEVVSDRFHYKYVKQTPDIIQLQKDNEERQRTWQDDFERMKSGLAEGNQVSDNIKLEVQTNVEQNGDTVNLVVAVSYETISVTEETDDYALGRYIVNESNACMLMCNFLRDKLNKELADYLLEGTDVDVKITGATDGNPIRSKIEYRGEYGDFNERPITLNGEPFNMTITHKTGITTNGQLAFLRTQGVENYLKNNVEPFKKTSNTYNVFAVENTEKGAGHRRVSVEITIHNAFDIKPQNQVRP